jgi:hypothetical protein
MRYCKSYPVSRHRMRPMPTEKFNEAHSALTAATTFEQQKAQLRTTHYVT